MFFIFYQFNDSLLMSLLENKGLNILQSSLLSKTFLISKFAKEDLLAFLERLKQ